MEKLSILALPCSATHLEPAPTIQCHICSHVITQPKFAIEIDGCHERTCRNPAGYSFHVLCFSLASGCRCLGTPTSEASWFADTTWTMALCEACDQHLGWRYASSHDSALFYGLIASRLTGWR